MPDTTPGEGTPSLRDTIAQSFEQVEQTEVSTEVKEDRVRDDKGRFSKGEEKTDLTKESPKELPKVEGQEKPKVEKPRPVVPKSWKPDYRTKWDTLDPEVAEYITQREDEMSRGADMIKSDAKVGKELMAEINPYMEIIKAEGGTPVTAVRDLMRTAAMLRTANPVQKAQLLLQVGQQFGADFQSLLGGQYQPQFDTSIVERTIEEKFRARDEQRLQQESLQEVDKFSKDPAYEHFESLRETMGRLLQAEVASDLKDAYQKALRLHPDLFEATQAKAKQAEDEKKRQEADRTAKAAKDRAVSVKTSTPASRAKSGGSGLRSQLEDAFDQLGGSRI